MIVNLRAIPLVAVAAIVLSVTGCVSVREVPPPISDADVQAHLQERVDAAWRNTGLEGTVERPEADPASYAEDYRLRLNDQNFHNCMQDAGITQWGTQDRDGGPLFTSGSGGVPSPEEQLTFYTCYAASPTDFVWVQFSEAELDYLYDYYQEWVVPCLLSEGYAIALAPTRDQFTPESLWLPYYWVTDTPTGSFELGLSQEELLAMMDLCGAPFGGLPYNEAYGY